MPKAAMFISPTRCLATVQSIWSWFQGSCRTSRITGTNQTSPAFCADWATYARVVTFDKRGTGMSDRVAELPGLDQRMDDLRAVMDAAGMEQAALLGISEGAPLSILFAATYPDRCRALVLYGSFSRFAYWFPTEEALASFLRLRREVLGHRWQRAKIRALARK